MANKDKYHQLLIKVLTNEATPKEQKALEKWKAADVANQELADEYAKTWQLAGAYDETIEVDTANAWDKLEPKIEGATSQQASPNKLVRLFSYWPSIAAAIAVLVVAAYGVFLSLDTNEAASDGLIIEVITAEDEQKEVRLPDNSIVTLNEHSVLTYKEAFEQRQVNLKGEAFFEVEKMDGKTFEVITEQSQTTVLGTAFNVRAYSDEGAVEVAVLSGKVAFDNKQQTQKVTLNSNEKATLSLDKAQIKKEKQAANSMAWKTQELVFENTKLKEVLDNTERFFGVAVNTSNQKILNCHFTGTFEQPNLQQVLKAVAFSTDLEVKQDSNEYILIGQGCD